MQEESSNILRLPAYVPPSVRAPLSYDSYRGQHTPLVIDNGATTLRYGFCRADGPLTTANIIAKYKERKYNKPLLLFGDGIDSESSAKSQAKMPWEGDVLLNFDALEHALDCAFIQLGIDSPSVDHPVIMTERLCSPLHSRALTSELMFEQYSVPSLTYCIDAPMSFYSNNLPNRGPFEADGLVISFNTASTSVIPMLRGKGILTYAKRISWGTLQASEYLQRLILPKYPNFPTRVTTAQTSWMLHNVCLFAADYNAQLRSMNDPEVLRRSEKIIQFPFTISTQDEKTEEELARVAERRREQGRKLQEMAAKSRMEKLLRKEADLQDLVMLREKKDTLNRREYAHLLESEGFEDETSLDDSIKKIENNLKKARKKEADADEPLEEPSFPLVEIPDADLDEESLKEKKKQKLMKAGFEARQRAKMEKEREKEEKEREEKKDEQERADDFDAWSSKMKREQKDLMTKIKDRARRKAALSDRKSAAAQARMKNIANLAADDRVPKKKRKGGGEDMFGADDADWAIYRKINMAAASSDEEEDLIQLQAVEQKLLAHDPAFTPVHTFAAITSQRSALISAFRPVYEEGDSEGLARIHLSTERWRVCEAWFSPNMAGVDSAGLGEIMQNVLANFNNEEKARLVQNVFLTGTPSGLTGLQERVYSSLRPVLPPETPISVKMASDPSSDAWRGMAAFAQTDQFSATGVTKAEYDEWGGEVVKRWWGGNWNSSLPPPGSR